MDLFGELMEQATKMDPTNPTLFFNLGVVNYNQDKVEEAQGYYKKAIELDPTYRDAYLNLGLSILNKRVAIVEEMNKSLMILISMTHWSRNKKMFVMKPYLI